MSKKTIRGRLSFLLSLALMTAALLCRPAGVQAALNDTAREQAMPVIRQCFEFFTRDMGYSNAAACGILANIDAECNFNPNSCNGSSFGLCQWAGTRLDNFYDFCEDHRYDPETPEAQLLFIEAELNGSDFYRDIDADMRSVENSEEGAYEAAYIFSMRYERPAGKEASADRRGTMARETYWPLFGHSLPVPDLPKAANSDLGIQVTWNYNGAADSYNVYRREAGDEEWTLLAENTTSSGFLDQNTVTGTSYAYSVEAINAAGCGSGYDPEGTVCLRLATPALQKAIALIDGIQVHWDPSGGASGYKVYRRPSDSDHWTCLAVVGSDITTYTDRSAEGGITWIYTIRAFCGSVLSAYDKQGISACYLKEPGLKAPVNVADGIRLSWTPSPGAYQFRIYRHDETGWHKIKTVAGDVLTWTHTDAVPGETYTYTVRAFNRDATLSSTFEKAGVTLMRIPAPRLTGLKNTVAGTQLKWNAVDCAETYRVYRRGSASEKWLPLGYTTKLAWTDTTPVSGSPYLYTVVAYAEGSKGDYDPAGLSVLHLAAPRMKAAANAAKGITVTWTVSPGADRNYIYRRDHGSKAWSLKTSVDPGTASWTDTSAVSGQAYDYVVKSGKDSARSSYETNGISAIRIPTPRLTDAANTDTGIRVTWQAAAGASSYKIYRREGTAKWKWIKVVSASQTAWTDTTAQAGRVYSYTVRGFAPVNGSDFYSDYDPAGVTCCRVTGVTGVACKAGSKKLTLTWTPVPGVTGYRICWSNTRTFSTLSYVTVKGASASTGSVTKLKTGSTAYARVYAYITVDGKNHYSSVSSTVSAKIK